MDKASLVMYEGQVYVINNYHFFIVDRNDTFLLLRCTDRRCHARCVARTGMGPDLRVIIMDACHTHSPRGPQPFGMQRGTDKHQDPNSTAPF
jgi:hypothetical protein